ncbi:hypothetical protein IBX38_07530 [Candidatus Bathyarchaeota archaeon]|nr:hypothetical protein [Candidatus Bathyarchaeota archaeon]
MKKEGKAVNENKEIRDILREILKWLRFIGKRQLRTLLLDALEKDVDKVVYELSDGRSLREIERICKDNGYSIGKSAIKSHWGKWKPLGILEPSDKYQGRYERVVSLKEVGIEFPEIKLKK